MALHLVKKKTCRPTKTIDNDFFVKHGISDFDVEVEKSKSLFAASVVGSFCAPKVLQFNSKDQSISFEYFEGIQSIRNVYLNYVSAAQPSDDDFQFLVKTGTVLAEIHELMHMHNPIDWIPSTLFKKSFKKKTGQDIEKLLDTMPWSIAHCDFGFSNIHYFQTKNHERELLIIDPSVNDFVTTETNLHAPIYVDLANLIACFSGLVPFRNYISIHWGRVDHVIQSIIRAYGERSHLEINNEIVGGMVYATAKCYLNSAYQFPFSSLAHWLLFTPLKRLRD